MKSVRCLVENLWRNLELDKFSSRRRALTFWEAAAGGKISGMCSLEGFSDSTVIVRAMNPAVAMELRYRSSEIVEALNEAAGIELFRSLKIVLRPTC
ncbi:MAG: DUF721 domain-containing protein [Candidatus Sabulitectum sp.]|nr:DUF721 domain-containing protein [Candidatus Sabulitectum sp.]